MESQFYRIKIEKVSNQAIELFLKLFKILLYVNPIY